MINEVDIKSTYNKNDTNDVVETGNGAMDPFKYYYNESESYRYPISAMRGNDVKKRLTINRSLNPDIKLIKSNHLHVCRYFTPNIPKNGFIDVTGYVATPLSRKRYEFWVNGRQITDQNNLIILSPSSFQMINLTSLKNFELIELVDSVNDSVLMDKGAIFVGIDGTIYSSYEEALKHNITSQNISYTFNTYPKQHTTLQNNINHFIDYPNNQDLEEDILSTITTNETINDYNQMISIPSINDTKLYSPTLDDIGMTEYDVNKLIDVYDKTYKYEILTDKTFPNTHKDESMIPENKYVLLKYEVDQVNNVFNVTLSGNYDNYFALYLSDSMVGDITNATHTKFIIPFIRTGIIISIQNTYRRCYLHATVENCEPIQLL